MSCHKPKKSERPSNPKDSKFTKPEAVAAIAIVTAAGVGVLAGWPLLLVVAAGRYASNKRVKGEW